MRSAIGGPCLVLALALLTGRVVGGDASPDRLSWVRAYEQGAERLRAGEFEAAVRDLRLAVLLNPNHAVARASLERARDLLGAELLRDAKAFLRKKQLRPAMPLLLRAADLGPDGETHEAAVRILRRFSHEPYEGSWRLHEDIVALEKRAVRIARNRRGELELPDRFALHRRARLRLFTDLGLDPDGPRIERLLDRLDEAVLAYRQLFLPFELDAGWEGLDVVLFASSADYVAETDSPDTVGVFLPARRASFFSSAGSGSAEQLVAESVLFHEVCHQLDFKLLGMTHPPPWLQEGIALLFEDLRPGRDGLFELHGPGSETRRVLAACRPGSERWIGLEPLVATRELRALHGTPEVHDFYAQAGALVRFLLSAAEGDADGPRRKALFYRLVAAARAEGARPKNAPEDFRHLLAEEQWTVADFEKNFVKALRAMSE